MKSEEDIDNIFKKGLEDPANHRVYNEDDWDAFEQMLDKGKKRRGIIYWLPAASSIAALLLLFLGWWFFKPTVVIDKTNRQQAAIRPAKPQNDINTRQVNAAAGNNQVQAAGNSGQVQQQAAAGGGRLQPSASIAADTKAGTPAGGGRVLYDPFARAVHINNSNGITATPAGTVPGNDAATTALNHKNMLAAASHTINGRYLSSSLINGSNALSDFTPPDFEAQADLKFAEDSKAEGRKKIAKQSFSSRPQFAVSVIASSDLNGVNSFRESLIGSNFGMLFTAGIFKKLSITTGVVYSDKPYMTSFANYNVSSSLTNAPLGVTADCRMLDIPINLGYQVFKNQHNKVTIGTGMSSYLMLNQKYSYAYDDPQPKWPESFTVPNSKSYLLSIVNINATYERKINSKLGINMQPYLKLPVTGVGYSNARLQSAGISVGLSYNFSAFGKR